MSYCLTSVGKRGKNVWSNVPEFGRKYFCFPGSNFCFCNESQCFQIWEIGKHLSRHWKSRILPRQCFLRLAKALVYIREIFNLFLDRVNCMYIYIFSVLFDTILRPVWYYSPSCLIYTIRDRAVTRGRAFSQSVINADFLPFFFVNHTEISTYLSSKVWSTWNLSFYYNLGRK
jgi:hypothetical protein